MNFLNDVCNISVAPATELFLVMLSTQARGPCHGLASSRGRFQCLQGKDALRHPQAISPNVVLLGGTFERPRGAAGLTWPVQCSARGWALENSGGGN